MHDGSPEDLSLKSSRPHDPGLSQIFSDAALYERVLSACPESLNSGFHFGEEDQTLPKCLGGFNELVGRDLGDVERAISGKLATLTVNNWASPEDTPSTPDTLSDEEPGENISTEDGAGENQPSLPTLSVSEEDSELPQPKLTPSEVIGLLEDEFGALAPPGEERLLLETDAAFLRDVIVLGVVHLTTHRFTFHASLLSSQPGYDQKIMKTGSALIKRKGWRYKKRVWMQLDHDMISTFPSSRDEDKIKPLSSILLSSIKEVKPVDWERPRHIDVVYDSRDGITETYVEYDTIEAARDWRNELKGVLFLYRRNRQAVLSRESREDTDSIRINIPLSRVAEAAKSQCLSFACMVSITISAEHASKDSLALENDTSSDGAFSERSETLSTESDGDPHVVQVSIIRKDPIWDDFMSYVDNAKAALAADATEWPGSRVYLDFDSTDLGQEESDSTKLNSRHISVARAIGLDPTKEFFATGARTHGRLISNYGHFAVNAECIGFWSRSMTRGRDVLYRIPITRVKSAKGHTTCKFGREHTLTFAVHGRRDFNIYFSKTEKRDEALEQALRFIGIAKERRRSSALVSSPTTLSPTSSRGDTLTLTSPERVESPEKDHVDVITTTATAATVTELVPSPPSPPSPRPASPSSRPRSPLMRNASSILAPLSRLPSAVQKSKNGPIIRALFPKAINVPSGVLLPMPSKHFVCLTIGSRGDVQPYIALGKALQKEGHRVTIVTHEEYKKWVTGFGISHRTAGGDPGALMKLSVENKMFSPQFFKESLSNFRSWLDDLLRDSWEQCKDADVLLESPSAMAGVHIAEALHIPYFRTFTMPWTKTREFPHAFLSPPVESPTFNATSYVLFDNVLWTATSSQINRWRKKTLGIKSTDMGHLAQSKIPFIYNFSSAVVPKPLDWGDATSLSGYWFLENPELNWTAPRNLLDFIAKARSDGKPLVYIGFGSITVPNPKQVTERLIRAVLKSDVRAIISKGWSARMSKPNKGDDDVTFPEECFSLDRVPHDWLFPQMDAVLHHGGAGTTGASLRAGVPTLIRPWFGDQYFWASRVQKLGAGLRVNNLHSTEVANALKKATRDRIMKEKAASIGERIRSEDGTRTAIEQIYTYLPRAGRDRRTLKK